MKKTLILLLALVFCLILVACDSSPNIPQQPENSTSVHPNDVTQPQPDDTNPPQPDNINPPQPDVPDQTEEQHKHTFGEWTVAKEATCTESGTEERVCSCGEKETKSIAATGHTFGEWTVAKEATCTEAGTEERVCSCGEKETKSIAATGHNYSNGQCTDCNEKQRLTQEQIVVKIRSTSGTKGGEFIWTNNSSLPIKFNSSVVNGTVCFDFTVDGTSTKEITINPGETKQISFWYMLGNGTGLGALSYGYTVFNWNGEQYYVAYNTSGITEFYRGNANGPAQDDNTELPPAENKVPSYISNRSVWYDDTNQRFRFLFAFQDENMEYISCPATVIIRIVNNNNETVYSYSHNVTTADFSTWKNNLGAEWLGAAIYIPIKDITEGTAEGGKLYYQIQTDSGAWKEFSLDISSGLPKKVCQHIYEFGICTQCGADDPSVWYVAGSYKVGTDIPAGDYYVVATEPGFSGYYCKYTDISKDKIEDNNNFSKNDYFRAYEGQLLELSMCKICKVEYAPVATPNSDGSYSSGVYRVGIDIPAGEYCAVATESGYSGYYCRYADITKNNIEDNDNFDNNVYFKVRKGEFLEINRCKITLVEEDKDTGTEDTTPSKWSYSDALNLNTSADKATTVMNTASKHLIDASTATAANKLLHYKEAIAYVDVAKGHLTIMQSLANSRVDLTLTNENEKYSSLKEKIGYAYSLCEEIVEFEITSENYTEYEDKLSDVIMEIYTECLGIQNLSVELLKAFS